MLSVKEKFKNNPLLYYALSICATWAGIGSLMNGVVMTQKLGIIPSLIWVLGNTVACILFGLIAAPLLLIVALSIWGGYKKGLLGGVIGILMTHALLFPAP